MTKKQELTPGELKRQAIIDGACALFRDPLGSHIDEACADANETLQRDEEQTEPTVKMGFTVQFVPTHEAPEVVVKLAWSVKRGDEAVTTVDPTQWKLPFEKPAA